jgi:hypothetical protein
MQLGAALMLIDDFVQITCWKCRTSYYLPGPLYFAAKANEDISFWCPYGHSAHYPAGETEETKLRRERNMLKQQLAQKDDEIRDTRQERDKARVDLRRAKKRAKRISTRVGHGVCPCCNRSFENLARHMATQHNQEIKEAAE